MDEILQRIIKIAKEKNIRQYQICHACGISQTNFNQWTTGKTDTYKRHLKEISELLGVSISYLVDGEVSPAEEFYTKYRNAQPNIQRAINELLEIEQK